jgi:anthranilate/para-aminobenzoate synthase component II
VRARRSHGNAAIHHDGAGLFVGLENPFEATRYHSLVIEADSCPAVLQVTARTADGEIMGVRHREADRRRSVHPESVSRASAPLLRALSSRPVREVRPHEPASGGRNGDRGP